MASNHWEDPDNWSPAGYPSGAGDTAEFDALSQTCVQTEPETVGTLTVKGAQQSGKIESEEPLTVDGGSMDSGTIAIDSAGSLNIAAGEFDMSGGAILMGQGLLAQGVSPNGGAGTQLIHVLSHTTYKLTNGETIGVGILNDGTVACNGCTATFVGQTNLTNRTGAFVNLLGANLNVSNLASTGEIDNSGIAYLYTGTTTSYLPVTNETGSSLELQSGI